MNGKRYKLKVIGVVILILLAGGLFVYDNIYLAQKERADKVNIYVAKTDIQANSDITEDMFMKLEINKDSVLPTYVTDFKKVDGMKLKGALLTHEPLTNVRLTESSAENEGEFSLKIEPDFLGDVFTNDTVRVYVQLSDKHTSNIEVTELFKSKKITKMTTPDNVLLSTGKDGVKDANVYIKANESELIDYYIAKEKGKIIVVKFDSLDIEDIKPEKKSNKIEADITKVNEIKDIKFDADSEIVKNAAKEEPKSDSGISVMSYVIQDGENIESLSIKFKTNQKTLSELNDGRNIFVTGETITVPAE